MREIGLAVRRLRHDPWAVAGAILAAALGAGLNTAVFAVAYGVLGRPLPYADADRLVVLKAEASMAKVDEWRTRLPSFDALTAYGRENLTVHGAGDARLATIAFVDDRFFETIGTPLLSGRTFGRGDTALVVLGERFVQQSGLAVDTAPGTRLTIGNTAVTAAGVVPAAFAFPTDQIDLWMPAAAAPAIAFDRSADARRFRLVGLLKPGVSRAQAADDVTRVRNEFDPNAGKRNAGPVQVEALEDVLVGTVRPVLRAFAAAAAIVLLVACANVATILIGRTLSRARELAVCRALGASPLRLFVSVVSESLLLSLAGAALGVAIAIGSVRLLGRWAAGIVPRLGEIRVDWIVLLFAVAVAMAAALLAALPAIRALGSGAEHLRTQTMGGRRSDRRLRGGLIVIQIALAVVLLAGGGLLARTINGLLRADIGVATHGVAVTQLLLTEGASFKASNRAPVVQQILDRVRSLPEVTFAGVSSTMPPNNASIELTVRFVRENNESLHRFSASSVTPGYLPAIGARIRRGRDFAAGDERAQRPVVVLSESAVRAFFPGETNILDRELPMALPTMRDRGHPRVIGVVSDIKYSGLDADAGPSLYVIWNEFPAGHTFLAARTRGNPAAVATALRAVVREVDPGIPAMPVRTLDEVIQRSVSDRRLNAVLGGSVALLAFAVAMVGLAASLMRVVSERRQELAIRAALGATPARAMRSVVGEGALLAGIGVALGLAGALGVGRALRAMVHGVSPHDPATLAGVAVVVAIASLVACYLPARRAARIDPLTLLRAE